MIFLTTNNINVLHLNFRGTMKKLGCTTWHLSRKSISPMNIYFLIMVSNHMPLLYHYGFNLFISIFYMLA